MSEDIFQNEVKTEVKEETPTATPTPTDPFTEKLQGIKGEDGNPKYKDVDTALDALRHSQDYIKQLKTQMSELESKATAAKEQEARLEQLERFVQGVKDAKPDQDVPKTSEVPAGMSEAQAQKLFEQMLSQRDAAKVQQSNLDTVVQNLTERFGDQAPAQIRAKADELGVQSKDLERMAKENPKLVLSLFGGSTTKTPTTPVKTSLTSPAQTQGQPSRPTVGVNEGFARGGRPTSELLDGWRKSKQYTNSRLGIKD